MTTVTEKAVAHINR